MNGAMGLAAPRGGSAAATSRARFSLLAGRGGGGDDGWRVLLGYCIWCLRSDHPAADERQVAVLPLAGHGGEGRKRCCWFSSTSARCLLQHPRATHAAVEFAAVIFGRYGGSSSTSDQEAFLALRRSSTTRRRQVVRPRRLRAGRRQRFFAGGETASIPLSDLGASTTLRSPANGGGNALVPDCFLPFSVGVFSVKTVALSSNFRFFRARIVKGPLCKMYPPRGMN